jgi:hypothetical protein
MKNRIILFKIKILQPSSSSFINNEKKINHIKKNQNSKNKFD